ncbi:MAG: SDR family oxidoreductase [Spirochaetaceae bacterium]|nr:SDR family oxidoreductase [Spirochaetaceae bacterium]
MRLAGKVALVTGAGRGFGKGIATLFAAEGALLAAADIDGEAAGRVAAEITMAGGAALAVAGDVSRDGDVAAMVAGALERYGRLDIVVNNAGTTHRNRPMLEVDEAEFQRVFDVNVKSVYLSARHAVPVFRRQGGGVMVNIASTAGVRPRPGIVWYSATKGAVITMSKAMALELAPERIRVVAVNPVISATHLLPAFLPGEDTPETRRKMIDTIPLGRMSTPLDVARACLFLASDEADLLTGCCLDVDGGRCV